MWKLFQFKLGTLVKILLLFSSARAVMANGLISRAKRNSGANDDGVSTRENKPEINKPNETWIVSKDISCWESNGRWEEVKLCPDSKIVTGHRFRFLSRTGLTGIQLLCSEKYGTNESEIGHILQTNYKDETGVNLPRGEWGAWAKRSHFDVAVGFSFAPGEMNLRRSVKNFDMIYHTENPMEVTKQLALNSGKVVTKCPLDHAICGVKWMTDKTGLGILTALGLKCCLHCVPEEKWVILHHHHNTDSLPFQGDVNATVSLQRRTTDVVSDLTRSGKAFDPGEISESLEKTKMFASIGKSNSTGFDWTRTADFVWKDETAVTRRYICKGNRSCVLKQLVGQCGSARVPVDKFCKVSTPIRSSAPESCTALDPIKSCSDAMEIFPSPRSTKQWIYPHDESTKNVEALCDFQVDGGGWTVIQKRSNGPREEFNRNWTEYSNGFGSLDGNFWLGLENIRALTKNGDQELRIELEDFDGSKAYAKYSSFSISDASDFYRLEISGFSGTAGDSMIQSAYDWGSNNGMKFSTKDKDNDLWFYGSCVNGWGGGGGWWFNNCAKASNLNGFYRQKGEETSSPYTALQTWKGIFWRTWNGFASQAKTEMKIRTRK